MKDLPPILLPRTGPRISPGWARQPPRHRSPVGSTGCTAQRARKGRVVNPSRYPHPRERLEVRFRSREDINAEGSWTKRTAEAVAPRNAHRGDRFSGSQTLDENPECPASAQVLIRDANLSRESTVSSIGTATTPSISSPRGAAIVSPHSRPNKQRQSSGIDSTITPLTTVSFHGSRRQSVRHRLSSDFRKYPHTHVRVELERGVRRALELKAFLDDVPYPRYGQQTRNSP